MKENEKDQKSKVIIVVALLLLLVMTIIGVTYAAFVFSKAGTVENVIKTGAVTMIYTEGENKITINNAMPMTDEVGKELSDENYIFDFTININIVGNMTISYEVTADKDPSSTLANDEVRLYLQKSLDGINYNDEVLEPSPYEPLDDEDEFGAKAGEMVIDVGSTNKTVVYYYRLRMWLAESFEVSDVAKKFTVRVNAYGKDGVYTPKPKNKNIKGVYVYNQESGASNYCVTGEEDTCELSGCYASNSADSCAPGTIIKYAVNDSEERYFHVIHDDGKAMTLQQRENIVYGMEWTTRSTSEGGPLTALSALEVSTENWTNVNNQTYTMGTTIFENNAYTGCSFDSLTCTSNRYTMPERTAKARMITIQELVVVGCTNDARSCPVWVYNYLSSSRRYGGTVNDSKSNGAYWSMSASTTSNSEALTLDTSGNIGVDNRTYPYDIRAVVVVNK